MPHIKKQKLVYNDDGSIRSGSAAVVETVYDSKRKGKCTHPVREKLGKILYLSEDSRSGIFLSPDRGLVEYDADLDSFKEIDRNDPRLAGHDLFPEPVVHTVFGDSYLLFCFLEKCGIISILRNTFGKNEDYERVLCHILHSILKNGSRISCDDFLEKSFASYVLNDIPVGTLGSDTGYFRMMGDDHTRLSFFRDFVKQMRKEHPSFGKGCYVDSTPLPNDIRNNPFNALCSHGVASTSIQTRLALVLDIETGLPVWYQILPGNVLDFNTIMTVMSDVAESLDIRIDEVVLDAGYVSRELLEEFNTDVEPGKKIIARMPNKKGYPYMSLYTSVRKLLFNAKYEMIRQGHTYFGIRKETEVFGYTEYAYVYVDRDNALDGCRDFRLKNEKLYEGLSMKDKNWYSVKFGFFILISNKKMEPDKMLDEYFGRTNIETVFKTSKEYLDLLPLSKWTDQTVRGKILSDIISTIVFLQLRKQLAKPGVSTTKLIGRTQSLMCTRKGKEMVMVETPNKQVKEFYSDLQVKIPSSFRLNQFKAEMLRL